MLDDLGGIFNPYSEFNIEVEQQNFCSHCGLELINNGIVETGLPESAIFCDPNCQSAYANDRETSLSVSAA